MTSEIISRQYPNVTTFYEGFLRGVSLASKFVYYLVILFLLGLSFPGERGALKKVLSWEAPPRGRRRRGLVVRALDL